LGIRSGLWGNGGLEQMANLGSAGMWVLELGVEVLMSRLRVLVDSVMERVQRRAVCQSHIT
jgi:hypothetical protein